MLYVCELFNNSAYSMMIDNIREREGVLFSFAFSQVSRFVKRRLNQTDDLQVVNKNFMVENNQSNNEEKKQTEYVMSIVFIYLSNICSNDCSSFINDEIYLSRGYFFSFSFFNILSFVSYFITSMTISNSYFVSGLRAIHVIVIHNLHVSSSIIQTNVSILFFFFSAFDESDEMKY